MKTKEQTKHTPTPLRVFDIREMDEAYWNEVERAQSAGNDAYDEVRLVRAHSKDEIIRAVNSHDVLEEVFRAAKSFMEEVTEDCPTLNKVLWKKLDKALTQAEVVL